MAFNRKKVTLTEVKWKYSNVNCFKPDKRCSTGKILALTAFNWKEIGVNGVQQVKQ